MTDDPEKSGDGAGRTLGRLLKTVIFFTVLGVALAYTFGTVVPPGFIGVRQVTIDLPVGLKQGFSERGLKPGYHWSIPVYTRIHLVPSSIQILNIDRNKSARPDSDALEVQTTDGSSVLLDISVLSRFYSNPGFVEMDGKPLLVNGGKVEHSGPGHLIRDLGPSAQSWKNTLLRDSVDELRRALGALSTSEFYNPHKREKQISLAAQEINVKLARWGIKVEGILVRRYTYTEQNIDQSIFSKNLQEQEERLNTAASLLSEAKATLEQVAAEMDARIATLKVEGENRARVTKSEGELYEAEKRAAGDLLLAKATAEVDQLRASVLADTPGAESFVAREMAPLLNSLSGGVVTDLDPYDINDLMRRLGMSTAAGGSAEVR